MWQNGLSSATPVRGFQPIKKSAHGGIAVSSQTLGNLYARGRDAGSSGTDMRESAPHVHKYQAALGPSSVCLAGQTKAMPFIVEDSADEDMKEMRTSAYRQSNHKQEISLLAKRKAEERCTSHHLRLEASQKRVKTTQAPVAGASREVSAMYNLSSSKTSTALWPHQHRHSRTGGPRISTPRRAVVILGDTDRASDPSAKSSAIESIQYAHYGHAAGQVTKKMRQDVQTQSGQRSEMIPTSTTAEQKYFSIHKSFENKRQQTSLPPKKESNLSTPKRFEGQAEHAAMEADSSLVAHSISPFRNGKWLETWLEKMDSRGLNQEEFQSRSKATKSGDVLRTASREMARCPRSNTLQTTDVDQHAPKASGKPKVEIRAPNTQVETTRERDITPDLRAREILKQRKDRIKAKRLRNEHNRVMESTWDDCTDNPTNHVIPSTEASIPVPIIERNPSGYKSSEKSCPIQDPIEPAHPVRPVHPDYTRLQPTECIKNQSGEHSGTQTAAVSPSISNTHCNIAPQASAATSQQHPKKSRCKRLGEISGEDVRLMKWRQAEMKTIDMVDLYEKVTGKKRRAETLARRCRQIKSALGQADISQLLIDRAAEGDRACLREINLRVQECQSTDSQAQTTLQAQSYEEHEAPKTLGVSDVPMRPNPPVITKSSGPCISASPKCSQTRTATPGELQVGRLPESSIERPSKGGKHISWDNWLQILNVHCETSDTDEAQSELQADSGRCVTEEDFCHFIYRVERRECTLAEFESGVELDDVPWIECGSSSECVAEANRAAAVQVYRSRPGQLQFADPEGAFTVAQKIDEHGMKRFTLDNKEVGIVETRVVRSLRSFHEGLAPAAYHGMTQRIAFLVKWRVTSRQVGDGLFEEDTETVEHGNLDAIFTVVEMANRHAIQHYVEMTFKSPNANLGVRCQQKQQAIKDLLAQQEEDENFSRTSGKGTCKRVEVWVEKLPLKGPRNIY